MANMKQIIQKVPVKQMVQKVEEVASQNAAEAVEKPSVGKTIASAALNLAKTAVPTALSFIPGVGPILGKIASGIFSANDDSWFEEFSPAGATFNELLKVESSHSESYYASNVIAGFISHDCALNYSDTIKDAQFPSILAYIRDKTNNVLIDDTDQYWKCFEAVANLYAIYFTGKKYIRLATELPTNIQQLDIPINAVNPKILSEFRGVIDNLGDYLKVTCALPEAYIRYLHWRYGTVFLSDNTDKAGLITYDYCSKKYEAEQSDDPVVWIRYASWTADQLTTQLQDHINYWKRKITLAGRAMADIKLAYKNMSISYDVEPKHYDAKEFNLRVNKTPVYNMFKYDKNKSRLIMTSQLNMSAALQAITLSTISSDRDEGQAFELQRSLAPFLIYDSYMGIYDSTALGSDPSLIARYLNGSMSDVGSGWFVIKALDAFNENAGFSNVYPKGCNIGYAKFVNDAELGQVVQFSNGPEMNIPVAQYARQMAFMMGEISLQEHLNNLQFIVRSQVDNTPFEYRFESNPLGYDTAVITREQLDAIQRTALRNLYRGNYHYLKKEEKADLKDSATEVIDVLTK